MKNLQKTIASFVVVLFATLFLHGCAEEVLPTGFDEAGGITPVDIQIDTQESTTDDTVDPEEEDIR